jgi:hypothetical protein
MIIPTAARHSVTAILQNYMHFYIIVNLVIIII